MLKPARAQRRTKPQPRGHDNVPRATPKSPFASTAPATGTMLPNSAPKPVGGSMTKRKHKHKPRAATSDTLPASPTPDELAIFPELALLAALHELIELTTLTLIAIHPVDIAAHFHPRSLDLRVIFADQIIELGVGLARATTCYRVAANEVLSSRH